MEKEVIREAIIHIRQIFVMQLNYFPHENLNTRKPVQSTFNMPTIHRGIWWAVREEIYLF